MIAEEVQINQNSYYQTDTNQMNPKASVQSIQSVHSMHSQHSFHSIHSQHNPMIYQSPMQNQFAQVNSIHQSQIQSPYQQQFLEQQNNQFEQQQFQQPLYLMQGQNLMAQQYDIIQQFQQANQISIRFDQDTLKADDHQDEQQDDEYLPAQMIQQSDQENQDDQDYQDDQEGTQGSKSNSDSDYVDEAEIQEEEIFDDPDFNLEEYMKVRDQL